MIVYTSNIEARLLDEVKAIKGEMGGHYALHFHFSALDERYRSEFQLKIAANILNDIFRVEQGSIMVASEGDIFVLYHGDDRDLLNKAIFQLRYLFMDDPLANHEDGSENEDFCTMYDLTFQWRPFYRFCTERLEVASQEQNKAELEKNKGGRIPLLTPARLAKVEKELEAMDLGFALRKQPVCAIKGGLRARALFHEVYVNISHFRRLLSHECDLTHDMWLFKYLTQLLDRQLLRLLLERPKMYLQTPISINMNVNTLLSEEFSRFCEKVEKVSKAAIVVEVDIADVFGDMHAFLEARTKVQALGCRVCLDGLDNASFLQVDRSGLGFDLAKLRWNADMAGDLNRPKNWKLAEAVERCGPRRIILCRCDSQHAIDYGNVLNISLFQGRYPDRMVDPDAVVIN